MSTTRERSLRAAVGLVGGQGVRALTHARVDAAAKLPPGSTSNHFRTRAALVAGVIEWIAEEERAFLTDAMTPAETRRDVVDVFCRVLDDLTTRHADRTRARYALSLEMAEDPGVQTPLRSQRGRFEEWSRMLLTNLGARHPDAATKTFMAFCSGLMLHRLTVDPKAPLRPTIDIAVTACIEA